MFILSGLASCGWTITPESKETLSSKFIDVLNFERRCVIIKQDNPHWLSFELSAFGKNLYPTYNYLTIWIWSWNFPGRFVLSRQQTFTVLYFSYIPLDRSVSVLYLQSWLAFINITAGARLCICQKLFSGHYAWAIMNVFLNHHSWIYFIDLLRCKQERQIILSLASDYLHFTII